MRNPYKIEDYGDDYTVVNYYRTRNISSLLRDILIGTKKDISERTLQILTAIPAFIPYPVRGTILSGRDVPSKKRNRSKRKSGERLNVRVPFYDEHYIPYGAAASSIAISSSCKNPEKAISFWSL